MANSINLVTKMLPLVDEIYQTEAVTNVLEAPAELVRETGDAKSYMIAKMALTGLGDYDKALGYPEGGVSLEWETRTFENDRGKRFVIDRADNLESFGLLAGRLVGDFTRDYLIPEVDAYRFAKIASNATTSETGTLTKSTAVDAIDEAMVTLQDFKVPLSRQILFVTPRVKKLIEQNITRSTGNGENNINNLVETYDTVPVIVVPQDRFYTAITLNPGTGSGTGLPAWGYEKRQASGTGSSAVTAGTDINFILMDRGASINITKFNIGKYFSPDENQRLDAHQFDFRLYGDSHVLDNKKNGIYVHHKSS